MHSLLALLLLAPAVWAKPCGAPSPAPQCGAAAPASSSPAAAPSPSVAVASPAAASSSPSSSPAASPSYGTNSTSDSGGGGGGAPFPVNVTPHQQFSSSIGVAGCTIDTNRAAYWPGEPTAAQLCVKVTYQSNSVYLLHIDSSAGAHDVSVDAFAMLTTGKGASTSNCPKSGGVNMMAQFMPASDPECQKLTANLAFLADNNVVSDAPTEWPNKFINMRDTQCVRGKYEMCTWNAQVPSVAPTCPSGFVQDLSGHAIQDFAYADCSLVTAQ